MIPATLLIVGSFVLLIGGCGAATPSPADENDVARFETENLACDYEAGTPDWYDAGEAGLTRAQRKLFIDQCRCAVSIKHGQPCEDAGALP